MKTASDIMTPNPTALISSMLVTEAVKKMMTLHISTAPVIDEFGKLLGQISEVSLLKAFILTSRPENATKNLKDFLQLFSAPTTVHMNDGIDKVVKNMMESENHRVIIVDDTGLLKGIISPKDILRFLVGEQSEQGTMMDEMRILKDRLGILKDQLKATKDQLTKFSGVIEKSDFMVHSVNEQGRILLANEKMHTSLGYSPKELIGQSIMDLYDINFHQQIQNSLKEIVEGRESVKAYATYLTKFKKPIRVEIFTTAIRDPMGKFISTSTISRVIDSEELLRALHGAYSSKD